ncbi:hypothetical protein V8E36_004832 [Tilletia maclaganii]
MKLSLALAAVAVLSATVVEARQRVLVFTKTARFRHDSIPAAIQAVTELGNATTPGWDTIASEDDAAIFASRDTVNQFDALIFISTTGEVLSDSASAVMRQYIQDGGSFVGVHAASDCQTEVPWYGRLVGAYFRVHPEMTNATLDVADRSHPSVSFLPGGTWDVYDEIYTFNGDPRANNHKVLLTVDDDSYPDAATTKELRAQLMGLPHPLAWYKDGSNPSTNGLLSGNSTTTPQPNDGTGGPGRAWYTSLGHRPETYTSDALFRRHLSEGIQWTLNSSSLRIRTGNASSPGQPAAGSPQGGSGGGGGGGGTGSGDSSRGNLLRGGIFLVAVALTVALSTVAI